MSEKIVQLNVIPSPEFSMMLCASGVRSLTIFGLAVHGMCVNAQLVGGILRKRL